MELEYKINNQKTNLDNQYISENRIEKQYNSTDLPKQITFRFSKI